MAENIVNSRVYCPKCKCVNLTLVEVWKDHIITWEQINVKFDRSNGNLEPGDPYRVRAICSKCQYTWRIKGALQIDDIIEDY